MAKLSLEEVEHIAKLSRLELTDDEKKLYQNQLSSVLEYVGQLDEVDTQDVVPTANITGLKNVFREDIAQEAAISYDDIKLNAPEFKDGYLVVPGVFE